MALPRVEGVSACHLSYAVPYKMLKSIDGIADLTSNREYRGA